MAERARSNCKEIDALRSLSLNDLSESGLDTLWGRLKTIMADAPDSLPASSNGSSRKQDARATLQQAERDAVRATNAAFDKMRAEVEEELDGAQKIKAAAKEAQEEAQAAVAQANEAKANAQHQAEEMISEARTRVESILAEAKEKGDALITEAEQRARKTGAEAQAAADEVVAEARVAGEEQVETMKMEAIDEIKAVRGAIERLQAALEDELETQRILTDAARMNLVSRSVAAGAERFAEQGLVNGGSPADDQQSKKGSARGEAGTPPDSTEEPATEGAGERDTPS